MINTFKKLVKEIGLPGNRKRLKKQFLFVIPLTVLLLVFDVKPAHALVPLLLGAAALAGYIFAPTLLGDLAFTVVGKVIFFVSYIISFIAGIFIAIEAWLIGAILDINTNLINSAPVKFGFPVSLSIVNLGFILGIIVIAIATILRYEQYGMKKILIKLIAAAILVNFSLVIAGVILNFADNLTGFFLKSVDPAGSVGGATDGLTSSNNFAKYLAGAFNPQRAFITDFNSFNATTSAGINMGTADALQKFSSSFGGDIAKILTPITSLVFVVFSLILIVITLFALIVMLVIRYVFLGILLVIMPFAWLLWVFPNFQSHWNKWWHNFLRWTFFAPIVVFFLWLGIQTSAEISNKANGTYSFAKYVSNSNSGWAMISGFFTNLFSPIVENFLQMTIVIGLMIGGLFAANSFGITFASTAMGAVKTVGKGLGSWAGNKGLQYAGAPFRKKGPEEGAKSRAERIRDWAANRKNPVSRYVAGWASRGVTRVSTIGGQDLVKDYGKNASAMTDPDLIAAAKSSTLFGPKKVAYLNEAGKRGLFSAVGIDKTHGKEIQALFGDFNQSDEYKKNIEKKSQISSKMHEAAKGGASQKDIDKLAAEFAKTNNRGDVSSSEINDLHSKTMGLDDATIKKLRYANAYGYAAGAPELVSTVVSHLKSESLDGFSQKYEGGLYNAEDRDHVIDYREYEKRRDNFRKIIINNTIGYTYTSATGATGGGATGAGGAEPGTT